MKKIIFYSIFYCSLLTACGTGGDSSGSISDDSNSTSSNQFQGSITGKWVSNSLTVIKGIFSSTKIFMPQLCQG